LRRPWNYIVLRKRRLDTELDLFPVPEGFGYQLATNLIILLSGQVSDVGVPSVEMMEPRRTRSELRPPSSAPSEKRVYFGVNNSATVQPKDHISISPP
jgi:hypothetical protein